MRILQLSYQPTLLKMLLSGLLGAWLHVLTDAFLYKEMNPFWPIMGNPLHAVIRYRTVFLICEASLVIVIVLYPAYAISKRMKGKTHL
jgi:membrane-bound metal-dependent hydrolase YbcI (DUF457 family)